MTVHEFIKTIKKSEYENYLKENLKDKEFVTKFLTVFDRLCLMKPKKIIDPLDILIMPGIDYFSEELTYIVEGTRKIKDINKIPDDYQELETFIERYSFSFESWRTVLSYTINENSLNKINKYKIISLIIDEITELGLEESDVITQKKAIVEKIKEAEKDIENQNFIEVEIKDTEDRKIQRNKMKEISKINLNLYYQYLK